MSQTGAAVGALETLVVRGWLEGRYDDISLVYAAIKESVADEWSNVLWTVPPKETMGRRYAFFGGAVPAQRREWFLDQLRDLIALPPEDSGHQLRGLFIVTDAHGVQQWRVEGRQVLTDPAGPGYEYLDDIRRG
jgi:hypothetical protein